MPRYTAYCELILEMNRANRFDHSLILQLPTKRTNINLLYEQLQKIT